MANFISPNNISIGKEEIDYICFYLSITKEKLINEINNGNFSFYFNISNQIYRINLSDPPHMTYELYILYKKNGKYHTQVFCKTKYPIEFKNLNDNEVYYPIFPLGYTGFPTSIEYPVYKFCKDSNVYSDYELNKIKSYFSLPTELIEIIFSYFVKKVYSHKNHSFILTDKNNLKNNIFIHEYMSISDNNIIVAVKSN